MAWVDKPALIFSEETYRIRFTKTIFPSDKYYKVFKRLGDEGYLADFELVDPVARLEGEGRGGLLDVLREKLRPILRRFHTDEYLNDLLSLKPTNRVVSSEIPLNEEILTFYLATSYGTVVGVEESLKRGLAINLGGGYHHAYPGWAEGFCYINDIAVALIYLHEKGLFKRAAVVDLDLHQGNGTAFGMREHTWCFTMSMHQLDNYPVPKPPSSLDIGFLSGTKGEEYLKALDEALDKVLEFKPEIVVYQSGVDVYEGDLLGGLRLSMEEVRVRDRMVFERFLNRGIPVTVTFGGGYPENEDDVVQLHLNTCLEGLRVWKSTSDTC